LSVKPVEEKYTGPTRANRLSAVKRRFFITTMALNKAQKQKIIDDLKDKIARQKAMVLVGITGLKVKDISDLRKKLKANDGNLKVAKKTLIERAFKESKLGGEEDKSSSSPLVFDKNKYKEEVALAFGFKDEISPAKIVYQFGLASGNLKILAGFLEGKFKEAEEIIALAQLPAKEELLAKLVRSIASPISGLVDVLQGNIKGLITVLAKAKT
jgi:large subunit ribosomal protein L10